MIRLSLVAENIFSSCQSAKIKQPILLRQKENFSDVQASRQTKIASSYLFSKDVKTDNFTR